MVDNRQSASNTFYNLCGLPSLYRINKEGVLLSIKHHDKKMSLQKNNSYVLKFGNSFKQVTKDCLLQLQFEELRNSDKCRPITGFEHRYLIYRNTECPKSRILVLDLAHSKFIEPIAYKQTEKIALTGINDKQYLIPVDKIVFNTFFKEQDLSEFEPMVLDNTFLINKQGSLYSTVSHKFISISTNSSGYLRYSVKFKPSNEVHRILAIQYIPGFKEGLTVNHIDGDKLNNSLSNLEWVSFEENIKHAWDNSLIRNGRKCVTFINEQSEAFSIEGYENIKKTIHLSKTTIQNYLKKYNGDVMTNGLYKGYRIIENGKIIDYPKREYTNYSGNGGHPTNG